ncbi:MAG TPA: LysR substrate-binding domain-containing protein, partial [Nocardioides sp.]
TVDLVATGHSEIGVVHSWGDVPLSIPDHLVTTELHRDIADVIAHRDHPLAQLAKVTPHDLVAEDWIATPDGTICRQWLNRMYAGTGHLPRIAHVSMEFDSHLALVRAGLGIALIPRMGRAALGEDLVAVRVVDPVPTREILALHRRTMAASPAVTAVLTALAAQNSATQNKAEASD